MILACPESPSLWQRFPVTWSLLAVNVFVFLLFFLDISDTGFTKIFRPADLRTAGRLYLQLQKVSPEAFAEVAPPWVSELDVNDADQMEFLGVYALRDRFFLKTVQSGFGEGDELALQNLRAASLSFEETLSDEPLHRFGLSGSRQRTFAWITYQFAHAGWLHLLSNMVFLLFIGWAIESLFGGSVLLTIYLAGGIGGGMLFLLMNPFGITPMVGASGSVSAMIAFYSLAEPRRRIRYYYFLLPMKDLQGFIYLPTLLIWPLYLVADVSGILSMPAGLVSGVAYSAHVGGAVFGLLAALHWRVYKHLRSSMRV